MNRTIKHLKLQTVAFMPDVGELGTVFPGKGRLLEDLHMTSHGADGITMVFTHKTKKRELWIPSANVVYAEIDPLPPVAAKAVK